MDDGPTGYDGARRPLPATRRVFRPQRRAPDVQLSRMEWDTVHDRGILLHRGSPRTRIVEGCADRNPTSNTRHLRRADHPGWAADRGPGGDAPQYGRVERSAC